MGNDEESELLGFLGDQTEEDGLLEVFEGEDGEVDIGEGVENIFNGEAFEDGGALEGVGDVFEDGGAFEGIGDAFDGDGDDCAECCECLCGLTENLEGL